MKNIDDISMLSSALYFAQRRHDYPLIVAYLNDFKPPATVEGSYYNLLEELTFQNYSEIVEKVIDLLANI